MRNKRAHRNRTPRSKKNVTSPPIVSTQDRKLVWKMTKIDDNSQWGWNHITCPDFLKKIWEKMRNFETMTWAEILGASHHAIAVKDLIGPAQRRLKELQQDDAETLISFHITGQQRIWAIRSGQDAFLLWWDPNHEICPSQKKHT